MRRVIFFSAISLAIFSCVGNGEGDATSDSLQRNQTNEMGVDTSVNGTGTMGADTMQFGDTILHGSGTPNQ